MIAGVSFEVFILLSMFISSLAVLALTLYKNKKAMLQIRIALTNAENALLQKQKQAYQMGANVVSGDMHQILGEFKMLDEYDELITLSTTSKAPSLDMIGIKDYKMDFIEFKKKGASLSPKERKIRSIVENKNIEYIVKDVDIPKDVTVETRKLKPIQVVQSKTGISSNTLKTSRSRET